MVTGIEAECTARRQLITSSPLGQRTALGMMDVHWTGDRSYFEMKPQ